MLIAACQADDGGIDLSDVYNVRLGGDTTAFTTNRSAFEMSARNLNNELRRIFEVGDSFFNQNWVAAPASTEARDGLGPTHNAQSCSSCHTLDGRGKPPDHPDDPERGLLLRLSIPDGSGGTTNDPIYGGQLQDRSILGVPRRDAYSSSIRRSRAGTRTERNTASDSPCTLLKIWRSVRFIRMFRCRRV